MQTEMLEKYQSDLARIVTQEHGKTIDDALANLKEVIEMCMEEQSTEHLNQFIGVREMEITLPVSA